MHIPRALPLAVVVFAAAVSNPQARVQLSDFGAEYQLAGAEADGDEVALTLAIRVVNHGSSLALGVLVTLDASDDSDERETPAGDATLATFEVNNLRPRQESRLERRIQVPAGEYARWREGYPPTFSIWFYDETGGFNHQTIPAREVAVLSPAVPR